MTYAFEYKRGGPPTNIPDRVTFPPCALFFEHPDVISQLGNASGTYLVAAIIAVAVLSAGITIAYHWSQSRFTVAYWGGEHATQIRAAEEVRLVDLNSDAAAEDISKAKGLVHFRQALIEDASFVGTVPRDEANPNWKVEVRFIDPDTQQETTVQFDLDGGLVGLPDREDVLNAQPIAEGLRTFFDDLGVPGKP